jgi:hypothetical protein
LLSEEWGAKEHSDWQARSPTFRFILHAIHKSLLSRFIQAIFKRCGPITQSSVKQTPGNGDVTVRLTFKQEKDAREAVHVFDKQVADGRTLGVRVVGGVNASLSGRLSIGVVEGSVDALMETDGGS